MDMPALLAEVT
jgi:hypothetical protein